MHFDDRNLNLQLLQSIHSFVGPPTASTMTSLQILRYFDEKADMMTTILCECNGRRINLCTLITRLKMTDIHDDTQEKTHKNRTLSSAT